MAMTGMFLNKNAFPFFTKEGIKKEGGDQGKPGGDCERG